jgi:acyl-CoA thioesterase
MWEGDRVRASLGLQLEAVEPGRARMTMRVADAMVNGHGLCHGGYLFTLADSAAAYAVNAFGRDAVASSASIEFLAPARLGEVLVADAVATAHAGRRHVLDVTVTVDDRTVAVFRGVATELRG